jgi:hypothetical protein
MPYLSGQTPNIGDRVKHRGGKTGTVTHVQLNYPSFAGRDAISVKFDDGSAVATAVADEYTRILS